MKTQSDKQKFAGATLRIGGVFSIATVLDDLGIDSKKLMAQSGIDPELLSDQDNLIAYTSRDRLMAAAVEESTCMHFGLLVGHEMNLQSLGLVGLLVRNTANVGAALRCLVKFLYLHSQGSQMELIEDDGLAILSYTSFHPDLEMNMQVEDAALAMMLNVLGTLCGPEFRPTQIQFMHREPTDTKPYQRIFGVPLLFNEQQNAMLFPSDWLDVELPGEDAVLAHILADQVAAQEIRHSFDFLDQVRSVLNASLRHGSVSEEKVAEIFSIQPRTLSRRLAKSGASFQELLDECRYNFARKMLSETSLTIAEIASRLGYSRSSAFIRSFRRWSFTTPAVWRLKNNRHGRRGRVL